MTVLDFQATRHVLAVTAVAEVVGSEAVEKSGGAAEHAFPIHKFVAVLFTHRLTVAQLPHATIFA
jgi:hypothetical protein